MCVCVCVREREGKIMFETLLKTLKILRKIQRHSSGPRGRATGRVQQHRQTIEQAGKMIPQIVAHKIVLKMRDEVMGSKQNCCV